MIKHGLLRRGKENTYARRHSKIIDRCYNIASKDYKNYGARGISVYQERHNVINFVNYMEETFGTPPDGHTIDRIDVNGNYEPGNIRIVDQKTQCRNKRNNVIVEIEGERMTLAEVSSKYGIKNNTLSFRYNNMGLRGEQLLGNYYGNICTIHGETMNISEVSKKYNINVGKIYSRYKKGIRGEELIKPSNEIIKFTIHGKTLTLRQISDTYGIPYGTIYEWKHKNKLNEITINAYKKH